MPTTLAALTEDGLAQLLVEFLDHPLLSLLTVSPIREWSEYVWWTTICPDPSAVPATETALNKLLVTKSTSAHMKVYKHEQITLLERQNNESCFVGVVVFLLTGGWGGKQMKQNVGGE